MRGLPHFNFDAFDEVRDFLVELGCEVVSPADHDREIYNGVMEEAPGYATGDVALYASNTGFNFNAVIMWDLNAIADCDAVYMLEGWENSTGARIEHQLAVTLGLKVYYQASDLTARMDTLIELHNRQPFSKTEVA